MAKRILVMSQYEAQFYVKKIKSFNPTLIVSISSSEAIPFPELPNNSKIIRCVFADSTYKNRMEPLDAFKIWQFIDKNLDKSKTILIHCFAGGSRSAAIGKVLSEYYQIPVKFIEGDVAPNRWCEALMNVTKKAIDSGICSVDSYKCKPALGVEELKSLSDQLNDEDFVWLHAENIQTDTITNRWQYVKTGYVKLLNPYSENKIRINDVLNGYGFEIPVSDIETGKIIFKAAYGG